jgi:hypothetical protein
LQQAGLCIITVSDKRTSFVIKYCMQRWRQAAYVAHQRRLHHVRAVYRNHPEAGHALGGKASGVHLQQRGAGKGHRKSFGYSRANHDHMYAQC